MEYLNSIFRTDKILDITILKSRLSNKVFLLIALQCLSGCSGLLPKEKSITVGAWSSFEEAQQTFDRIIPYQTSIEELKELKIDPERNPNIEILNYSDISGRFIQSTAIDGFVLDDGVKECISAKTNCRGYEIKESVIKSKRYGNFWSDLLNFKRKTDTTGWRFNGIVLINNNLVVYKLSSGLPAIHTKNEKKRPLGPLQSGGIAIQTIEKNL